MKLVDEISNEFYDLARKGKLEGGFHDFPPKDVERLVKLTLTRLRGHLEHKLGGPHATPVYYADDILTMLEEVQ